jgi:Protein of unknown function (DUF3592)
VTDSPSSAAGVRTKPVSKWVIALSMLAYAAIGVWQTYSVVDGWHWLQVEENWASTDGTIETAFHQRTWGRHVNYETGWTYSYSVNGVEYQAQSTALSNAYFVRMRASEQDAEAEAETRPIGGIVTVYYDPAVPQHSVLDLAEDGPLNWTPLIFSAICFGLALLYASALIKAIKNSPS